MADEWIPLSNPNADGFYRRGFVTVADGTAIAKHTLMVMSSDPNTGIAHSGLDEIPLGVTLEEKEANDGKTRLAVAGDGDWDVRISVGGGAVGDILVPGDAANSLTPLVTPGVSYSNHTFSKLCAILLEQQAMTKYQG